jgi:AraC-like DNA-binding protein
MKAFRFRTSFWARLQAFGIAPSELFRGSGLSSVGAGHGLALNTAQWFALWRSMASMGVDPATAFSLAACEFEAPHPLGLVLQHARTLGDALARIQRYRHACTPGTMEMHLGAGECAITFAWPRSFETVPGLLTDAALAALAEVGRRGVGPAVAPARVELCRRDGHGDSHVAYFQCPVKFGAARDAIVFRSDQLNLAFHSYRDELAALLREPWPDGAGDAADKVQWVLARLLSGCRPDIAQVAHELRVTTRTLQRRITDEGQTFRGLLTQTRQGLARVYLAQPSLGLDEVAFLLGFEDGNSFFRAFRRWEGQTPGAWRADALPP